MIKANGVLPINNGGTSLIGTTEKKDYDYDTNPSIFKRALKRLTKESVLLKGMTPEEWVKFMNESNKTNRYKVEDFYFYN